MADTKAAVDAAQERTKAYLPQIQAALDTLKSQGEKPPPLIADAELYTGKVRDVYKPKKFPPRGTGGHGRQSTSTGAGDGALQGRRLEPGFQVVVRNHQRPREPIARIDSDV